MGTNYTRSSVTSGFDTEASINQNFIDIQTALERAFSNRGDTTNGSNSMFTDIDMQSGYKLINLPQGTENQHSVNLKQVNEIATATISGLTDGNIAATRETGAGSDLVSDVWTFSTINYTLSVNNLYVFVNGVLQNKGADYSETSTTSITFIGTNKPQTNDSLLAVTNLATTTQIVPNPTTATTTQLADISDPINTDDKSLGRLVYNSTTNRPVWSGGTSAGDVWRFADGTTAHTPV